ncbi:hypothetical protein Tco_0965280 [Tanacetum coccineum]
MTPCSHYGHALMLYRSTLLVERHCCADYDSFDLPLIYNVNGHNLHFGQCEFCLVTGFKFALIEDEEKFSKVSDEDAIRLCLLLSLKVIFMGWELVLVMDDVLLRMVDNLDAWNTFPWDLDMDYRVFLLIGSLVDQSAITHPPSGGMDEKNIIFQVGVFQRAFSQGPNRASPNESRISNTCGKATLIDRVHDLEGLCESLLTLSKEVKSLRGRVFKLESIIHVITLNTNRVEKEESLNKFGPQIEDLLKSTSEDEPDIIDNTSKIVEKDVGDVYCCDVNGHVPGVLMPANPVSQPIYGDFSFDLAFLNGFCNLSQNEDEKGDCEIIRLADQRQQDDISKMAEEAEQKIKSEIQRLYDHREASMEQLANQKNVLNPLMIEKCKSVKPWIEDLKCSFNRIDRIFLSHDLEEWLSRSVMGRCKFPWCNDISVDRSFWQALTFCQLLLQGSMPKFYANNAIYLVGWSNVERVFISINEPRRNWSLAMFHICSRICLEEKILVVLKETGVFEKKNIDPKKYKISFRHADHVPKQGGVFGDCGLTYGVPLAVDDPVQAALTYHEK